MRHFVIYFFTAYARLRPRREEEKNAVPGKRFQSSEKEDFHTKKILKRKRKDDEISQCLLFSFPVNKAQ